MEREQAQEAGEGEGMKTYTFTEEQLLTVFGSRDYNPGELAARLDRMAPIYGFTVKDDAPPPRTVRVRIAVATIANGHWVAEGGRDYEPDVAASLAIESLRIANNPRLSWVEADVPLPEEPATVQGEVRP